MVDMQRELDLVTSLHQKSKRNYLERVTQFDKGQCATVAKLYGKDYWDGQRQYGYGGYHYDGRWAPVAMRLIEQYSLTDQSRILDVGCGKGYLLYEIKKLLPGAQVRGIDISEYALRNSKEEIRASLSIANATKLPFSDQEFDLVISLTTLHNLMIQELAQALKEIQRVTQKDAYLVVESYRNESEKANLLYWQLTCESFFSPTEWIWLFDHFGYRGDYEFICFT